MRSICGLICLLTAFLLANSDFTNAQTRRSQSPRAGPTGRALGVNPKGSSVSSSSSEFSCPEEFGYFPHPSDCSLYYVCVFGGALLESCTGGLMYSHELQTCDWPRNVGCEISEVSQGVTAPAREVTPRVPQVSVPSRIRFSSVGAESPSLSAPSASGPSAPAHIQQIHTLPPPPDQQRISPKPVITSRGQPPAFTNQDEILKQLYAEAHDTLPPAEEEESDRQQRVYRGQPSTVTQVQRDRDGIIHQPSVNAIPTTQQKVGSFAFSNSQIPTFSEDELQDLDITKHKVLDRKRRDLSSQTDDDADDEDDKKSSTEIEHSNDKRKIERRSNKDEAIAMGLDDELLEGSENSDDVQRRTRQLRPSIISSPWRISSARAVNFAPSHQNSFGSSFNSGGNFPSSQSGFLFKSDGRFYPNNPFKSSSSTNAASSSDDFQPVISTYSGNIKNKYNSFSTFGGSGASYSHAESSDQEPTPKYKQSSKIPSHSPAILPLLYSLESFEPKAKTTTQAPPGQDNYSYFHIGKPSSSSQQQQQQQQDKVKAFAYPVTNQPTTTQRTYVSFNSVGGFFNNNQQQQQQQQSSNQGFLPLKPIQSNKATPAPIYEGTKSASSYDSRYTTPSPIKTAASASSPYPSSQFLNNLSFKNSQPSLFNFGIDNERPNHEEKIVEITTKKFQQNYKQYPIPTSTPKYINAFTTPNQLFDVDKFIAELRETQRLQNLQKIAAANNNLSPDQPYYKNQTQNAIRYQYYSSPSTTTSTTTALPDEYYYDDEEEEEPTYDNGVNLSKLKVQNDNKVAHNVNINGNKDSYSSHSLNKKPPSVIHTNAAAIDDDEYYEDYEDEEEEEEFQFLPPPVNKPKYIPMTETMAPRPINVTTLRPYYVSGHTFSTPPPHTSTVPSIIKFPDDVFQAIRPFTSPAPKIIFSNNNKLKPVANYDITKGTTSSTTSTSTTTERTTTRKTKVKIVTKATTKKVTAAQHVTSTTFKPTRTTTKRKQYTNNANHRGNSRFKASTKRPDLTRLEIDEKLPNRVEQSSPAPNSFNIPQKTQITQNKNYYNTSNNYNSNFDSFYPVYDDDVEIYRDVDYSNIYNNQPKSTPSSTYRPSTTQTPQTFAPKPQTQSTTYLTQTQSPKQKYNQDIYSSADYDEALVAQLQESERYGQQEEHSSDFRGDRNELNPLSDRTINKVQSSSYSNGPRYSSIPAIVKISTPEPFSFKPTASVTYRPSVITSSTTRKTTTTTPFTFPPTTISTTQRTTTSTSTTTTQEPYYTATRSSLSDGTNNNKTANNRYRITLSARAGSLSPVFSHSAPSSSFHNHPITPLPLFHNQINHTVTLLPPQTTILTSTTTTSTSTTTTSSPLPLPPSSSSLTSSVQVVNTNNKLDKIKSHNNNKHDSLSDHYYYQDGPIDYYDNVDEISIPSSSIKPLNIHNNNNIKSLSSSSNSLSLASNVGDLSFKLPNLSEHRYDQSTLKSYFMNSKPSSTTESLSLANLRTLTTTERPPASTTTNARDIEAQRQKILSFIISENQPSSFKAPSTTSTTTTIISTTTQKTINNKFSNNFNNNYNNNAYVNTQETTTSSTQSSVINQSPKTTILLSRDQLTQNKPIRLTLTSAIDDSNGRKLVKDQELPRGNVEEIPLIKSRQSLHLKPIEPTTYSPSKPFRHLTTESTTTSKKIIDVPSTVANSIDEDLSDPDALIIHSRRRPYVNDFLTTSTILPARFPLRTTSESLKESEDYQPTTSVTTTTPRSLAQSFTSRGQVFKEILNKTFDSQVHLKPIVSPYASLESQRLTNAIRTTTPRTNLININSVKTTTTSVPSTLASSTYKNFFFITAPPKISSSSNNISTYLFPESSTAASTSTSVLMTSTTVAPTASPLILSHIESTEQNSRGRYRPIYSFSSPNSVTDEEATTYSPRSKFNTRTQAIVNSYSSTSEQPAAVRRKVIRLKSQQNEQSQPLSSSTERVDVTTYNPARKFTVDNLFQSPVKDKNDIRPILTKLNEFISKLSHAGDIFSPTPRYNDLTNENVASVVEVTEKPFYYTRLSNTNSLLLRNNNSELHETSTKRFRATVEMPEMKVPEEKGDNNDNDEEINYADDDDEEIVARVNADKNSSSATTQATKIYINTTYSTQSTTTATQTTTQTMTSTTTETSTTNPKSLIPPRATRVNNAIKSSIIAGLPRRSNSNSASIKCNDVSSNAKCNEIPSRTSNRNQNRDRGSSPYAGETQSTVSQNARGTPPPQRARPTLKPSQTVVKDAQQFVDIYRYPPSRPEPLYPQPIPDKTAAKCRKDVCLLPDCYCGGKDIPGKLTVDETPQLVLITFEDSVNEDHNKVFEWLFNSTRKNPNGCDIRATFFISHEWTDYSLVQNLYADGHEIASHTISHSFGEQFSLKKWAREIAGQREILSAYGGVKQEDIRGMRAPFLSIGGNKMFKMLYDFNFTYDSSMPVYENRPPSWPYTLDYKIFHDCMIPPCPTKSYPGVWEVPMVMWQDLNGGRCSMGDACSNPADADGVFKMIMKNFERHYTTNRAPFGLFYHAAWFTQPHHKEGFIEFLDAINRMKDVYIVTNWQALQWVRDPTPISRMNSFQPFQCNYQDRPKRCNNPKVCNLWHKSGVRYMRTCQPCPEIYPWTGKTGIRSSRIDNDLEVVEST